MYNAHIVKDMFLNLIFVTLSLQYLLLSVFQIIDPFVEVEVIGLPVDCFKEQTRVVDDNGKIMWFLVFFMAEISSFRQVLFVKIQVDDIWSLLGQSTEKLI